MADNLHPAAGPPSATAAQTIGAHVLRTFGYGVVSCFALLSGYWSRRYTSSSELWILAVLGLISVCFAFVFSLCFHRRGGGEKQIEREENLVGWVVIGAACVAAFFFLWGYLSRSQTTPLWQFWTCLALYLALFAVYAIYLSKTQRRRVDVSIRHRLVWPSLLAVAVNFYYGTYLPVMTTSVWPLVPPGILGLYILFSERTRIRRRGFLWTSMILIVLVTVAVGLQKFGVLPPRPWLAEPLNYFATFLFAMGLTAFLGVFEACHITARLAEGLPQEVAAVTPLEAGTTVGNYYVATLLGLATTVLVMPLFYVFANVSLTFLVFFAIEALAILYLWSQYFRVASELTSVWWSNWNVIKNCAGFLLLALPVLDFWRPWTINALLPNSLAAFLTALGYPMTIYFLVANFRDDRRWRETYWDAPGVLFLFERRLNVSRVMAMASWIPMGFLFICQAAAAPAPPLVGTEPITTGFAYKVGPAFVTYLFIVSLALIIELLAAKPVRPKGPPV